jgi:hypothetical protein
LGRYLTLSAVLLVGYGVSLLLTRDGSTPARWPENENLYQVNGWIAGPLDSQSFEKPEPGAILQRAYRRAVGESAQLVIWTVPQPYAKTLFRKGPDRDFLGAGYTSTAAPSEIARPTHGGARLARRGDEVWLLLYTFGERRGVLGNGIDGWLFAELDALLDRPNDYFLIRAGVPIGGAGTSDSNAAVGLVDTLAQRVSSWYAE